MHVVCGYRQMPIDFQQWHIQNGHLEAILDFMVFGLCKGHSQEKNNIVLSDYSYLWKKRFFPADIFSFHYCPKNKVMYTKALPITNNRYFHIESKKWSVQNLSLSISDRISIGCAQPAASPLTSWLESSWMGAIWRPCSIQVGRQS